MDKSDLLSIICPIPFVNSHGAHDGWRQKAASCCKGCTKMTCLTPVQPLGKHGMCEFGMSFIPLLFQNDRVSLAGFIHTTKNNLIRNPRRKDLQRLWMDQESIDEISQNITRSDQIIEAAFREAASETIAFLHDIRTSLSLVMSSCERLIGDSKGNSFSDKLKRADPSLFRLYQAIRLLTEQLGLADILSNPSSATYGQKSTSDIYQFFYKMVKLFEPRAWDRGMHIHIEGNIYHSVALFNSFQLLPIVILDNAIKYGTPGSTIFIKYADKTDGLYIEFDSLGTPIPPEFEASVFKRGVRGPNVTDKSNVGSGLGLYIADMIVNVHGFHLSYEARPTDNALSRNCFILFIESAKLI